MMIAAGLSCAALGALVLVLLRRQLLDLARDWLDRVSPPSGQHALMIPAARHVAADGATGPAPAAGAREVPAPAIPLSGAGASPGLPDAAPGEVTAPASPGAAARRDTWVTWQDPPGTPQVTVSGKPTYTVVSDWRGEWAIEHGTGTVTRAGHWRGGAGRDTIAMPAADGPPRARYVAAHLAWQDQAAAVITS